MCVLKVFIKDYVDDFSRFGIPHEAFYLISVMRGFHFTWWLIDLYAAPYVIGLF